MASTLSCNIRERYEEVLSVDRGEENLLPLCLASLESLVGRWKRGRWRLWRGKRGRWRPERRQKIDRVNIL